MDGKQLEKTKKEVRGLKQYANASEEIVELIAIKRLNEKALLDKLAFVSDGEEKEYALRLFDNYLSEYEITTSADRDTLCQLVDLEVLGFRLKQQINAQGQGEWTDEKGKKHKSSIPPRIVDTLLANTESIKSLKTLLGMTKDDKSKSASDYVRTMETMKQRFHDWINLPDNRANYTLKCPSCQNFILIRRRIDKELDATLSHPWFIDGGILFNKKVFELYLDKKISEEDVKGILQVGDDYLAWILKHYRMEIAQIPEEPKTESETSSKE